MKRRGQSAIEYLMTYGWAILVVIIVGVVLWHMGILDFQRFTPGSKGFGSVKAKDWSCSAASGNVQVQWVNGAGEKITLTALPNGGCVDAGGTALSSGANVSANAIVTCTYNALAGCSGLTAGDRFESVVTLSWRPAAGGIAHTESGTVWKAAEE